MRTRRTDIPTRRVEAVSNPRSRSASRHEEEELRLPRPPGIIRRFWARHPLFADILIALVCLLLSIAPATVFTRVGSPESSRSIVSSIIVMIMVVIACVLLLRRRQWPIVVFVASYAVAVAYLFLLEAQGGPLLVVASYTLAVYRSTRAAWIGFGIGIGSLTLIALLLERTGTITLQVALNAVAGQLTLALIGTLIGVNVGGASAISRP